MCLDTYECNFLVFFTQNTQFQKPKLRGSKNYRPEFIFLPNSQILNEKMCKKPRLLGKYIRSSKKHTYPNNPHTLSRVCGGGVRKKCQKSFTLNYLNGSLGSLESGSIIWLILCYAKVIFD